MLGLGVPEIIFILVLALLLFGPKRLPEIGRTLGKGLNEFRKASNELKRTLNTELALDEEDHPRPQASRMTPGAPFPVVAPPAAHAASVTFDSEGSPVIEGAPATVAAPIEPSASPLAAPSPALERPVPAGALARGEVHAEAVPAPASAVAPASVPAPAAETAPVAVTAAPLDPH